MEKTEGNKISIVRIAQVLFRESDRDHPLTRQEIKEILKGKYGLVMSLKAIGRNLVRLKESGLPVQSREVSRMVNGKAATLSLDWYWEHDLTKEEMQLLIDGLYFSHLPQAQVKGLVEKIKRMQYRHFDDGKEAVRNLPVAGEGKGCMEELSLVSRAIREQHMVTFYINENSPDGKWHHQTAPSGEDRLYTVSPYMVLASDGSYYLLANRDGTERVEAYPLEQMDGMALTEREARALRTIAGFENGIKMMDYVHAMGDLFFEKPLPCAFEASPAMVTRIFKEFGKAAKIVSASPEIVRVEAKVAPSALKAWALRHAPAVKVIAPAQLAKEVRDAAAALARLYGG